MFFDIPCFDDRAQTSPVHQPEPPDFEGGFIDVFNSPMTCPDTSFDQKDPRYADFSSKSLTLDDVLYNYKMIEQQMASKATYAPIQTKPKKKKRAKTSPGKTLAVFKPYVSFESAELAVHQLRTIRDQVAQRERDRTGNVTLGSEILSFLK